MFLCRDDVEVLPPISTSDHNTVCFKLCQYFTQQHSPTKESPPRHNFAKADWENICNFLAATDWHVIFSDCYTADDLWNAFISVVQQAINKFVPRYKHSRHTSTPCLYPRYIRKLLTTKRARWKLFHKFRTLVLKVKYNNAAKKCSEEIKKFTIEKENRLCENENLGAFYKYVNKKLNGSNGIAPLKDKSGTLVSDDSSKAKLLNDYFCSIFTQDN